MIRRLSSAALLLCAAACAPVTGVEADRSPAGEEPSQCRADAYRSYIDRNRSELPAQPAGATWRVTCTTCPVTMDYNPARLNILFDENSGVIREVKCG